MRTSFPYRIGRRLEFELQHREEVKNSQYVSHPASGSNPGRRISRHKGLGGITTLLMSLTLRNTRILRFGTTSSRNSSDAASVPAFLYWQKSMQQGRPNVGSPRGRARGLPYIQGPQYPVVLAHPSTKQPQRARFDRGL